MIEYVVLHPWRVALTVIAGVLLGLAAFYAFQLQSTLDAVATEDFDPASARVAIGDGDDLSNWVFVEPADDAGEETSELESQLGDRFDLSRPLDPDSFNPYAFGAPIEDSSFTSYLLVGSDASGFLADVIILVLEPDDGTDPIMVSLPRDLYVWNLCNNSFTRLNAGLGGCRRVATGTEMMAILVEDYTGIAIDHSARVDFSGFARIVDALGGTTICVDYPTRDAKSHLDLPDTGCRRANGATTLAWVRSRHTEQLRAGEWVQVAGSDFARQNRQQDVLFQLAAKAASFTSPASLGNRLSAVASAVRLDSTWSFAEAVATGWRHRGVSKEDVRRFTIGADAYRTPGGAAVLLPSRPFIEELAAVYQVP